jgi:hypothetical protein
VRGELAQAHESAYIAAHAARDAPNTEQANVGRECMRKSARITLFESRLVINVEEEEGERAAKRSVHLNASDDVRWEEKG